MMLLIDLLSAKQYIVVSGSYTIDILIICEIIFLHILTMQPSNSLRNEWKVFDSRNNDKKIMKLIKQIMLLFWCFITPQLIMSVSFWFMQDKLMTIKSLWLTVSQKLLQ